MEMRIVVADTTSSGALAQRLAAVFGGERVSLWPDHPEVMVRVEGESDRAVIRVLDTVERWLDQTGLAAAEMWLGENSYRLARSASVEAWQ